MKHHIYSVSCLVIAAFIISGCGKSDDSNNAAPTPGLSGEHTAAKDVSDYSQCNNGFQANQITGAWQQSFQQGDFTFDVVLDIGYNQVTVFNECHLHGQSLRVSTSSPSSFTRSQFTVSSSNENHQEISDAGSTFSCDVSVKPMSVNYSFQGSCLVMMRDGQKMVFLPR